MNASAMLPGSIWILMLLAAASATALRGVQYLASISGSRPICGSTPHYESVRLAPTDRTVGFVLNAAHPDLEALFCAQHALAPRVVKAIRETRADVWATLQTAPVLLDADSAANLQPSIDAWASQIPADRKLERREFPDGVVLLQIVARE